MLALADAERSSPKRAIPPLRPAHAHSAPLSGRRGAQNGRGEVATVRFFPQNLFEQMFEHLFATNTLFMLSCFCTSISSGRGKSWHLLPLLRCACTPSARPKRTKNEVNRPTTSTAVVQTPRGMPEYRLGKSRGVRPFKSQIRVSRGAMPLWRRGGGSASTNQSA